MSDPSSKTSACECGKWTTWRPFSAILAGRQQTAAPFYNGDPGPTIPGVDRQIVRAASEMTPEQKAAPEWLWHEDHRNVTSYGRWLRDPSQAPYIRADIVLALLEAARAR